MYEVVAVTDPLALFTINVLGAEKIASPSVYIVLYETPPLFFPANTIVLSTDVPSPKICTRISLYLFAVSVQSINVSVNDACGSIL